MSFWFTRAAREPVSNGSCVVLVPIIFSHGCGSPAAASTAHCTATAEAAQQRVSRDTRDVTATSIATRSRPSAPFHHILIHYLPRTWTRTTSATSSSSSSKTRSSTSMSCISRSTATYLSPSPSSKGPPWFSST
jgi:hypothetical protein